MSQEAGRHECPVPAGGFEVFADRRHTYIGFRPSLNGQGSDEHQHSEDSEQLELDDVQKENSLASCEGSSSMVQVPSDDPLIKNTETGEQVCQSISNHTVDVDTLLLSFFSCGLESNQNLGNFTNLHENSEDLAEYMSGMCNYLNGQNAIAYVNIDSYEPDSSDGDEDDTEDQLSLVREEAGVFQKTLDNMLPDLHNITDCFTDLQSQHAAFSQSCSEECHEEAEPMPSVRYFSIDSHLACSNNRTVKFSAEDAVVLKSDLSGASYETQQTKKRADVGVGTPVVEAKELNASGMKTDQRNPPVLVVRPKVRKQITANELKGNKLIPNVDEEESGSWRITEIAEVQGPTECTFRNSKEEMSSSIFCDSGEYQDHQRKADVYLSRYAAAQELKNILDDSTCGDEFEDFSRHFSVSHRDEDSSECSDGEWRGAMPACSAATGDWSSSDDSWEAVPFLEECKPEVQNSSSGEEEKSKEFCFQGREQTLMEEGEIPWLWEEPEGSSDEEDSSTSDFLYPGFFLLGENNNLEDDSSVGEDLDVMWRLLDEFGDGLGLAQANHYMDSQFLTFMALEEHLQQAMESGTHPVCRYMLEPVPPEAAAYTVSSSSDHDSASSVHSATEGSN